ncbi:MAG: hypothetical protein WCF67_09745 [Chitinophagaceae bacterium]
MKYLLFVLICLSAALPEGFARNKITTDALMPDSIPADKKDVSSIDGIVAALYDVISGPAGQKRNWDRMRTLFIPEARLIPTGKRADGSFGKRVLSVEDYINTSGPFLEKNGFFELELSRKTEQFGSVVHIFSTYASKKTAADEKPFMRGINSIQLWNDGTRWWIITILWENESAERPLPEKYLKN